MARSGGWLRAVELVTRPAPRRVLISGRGKVPGKVLSLPGQPGPDSTPTPAGSAILTTLPGGQHRHLLEIEAALGYYLATVDTRRQGEPPQVAADLEAVAKAGRMLAQTARRKSPRGRLAARADALRAALLTSHPEAAAEIAERWETSPASLIPWGEVERNAARGSTRQLARLAAGIAKAATRKAGRPTSEVVGSLVLALAFVWLDATGTPPKAPSSSRRTAEGILKTDFGAFAAACFEAIPAPEGAEQDRPVLALRNLNTACRQVARSHRRATGTRAPGAGRPPATVALPETGEAILYRAALRLLDANGGWMERRRLLASLPADDPAVQRMQLALLIREGRLQEHRRAGGIVGINSQEWNK